MVIKVNDNGVLKSYAIPTAADISGKLDAPATAGTSGQILALNSQLAPVWVTNQGTPITLKTWTSSDIGGGS